MYFPKPLLDEELVLDSTWNMYLNKTWSLVSKSSQTNGGGG